MINSIQSKLEWNGIKITNFYFNHEKYYNIYWNGEKVLQPKPIGVGDFIWYPYNPNYGYSTNSQYENILIDHGSTNNYNAIIHSGRLLDLNGKYLEFPTNPGGSIIYFDFQKKKFVQERTQNNTFKLENKIISSVVILWNRLFSYNDLNILSEDPIKIIRWALGEKGILSIDKKHEDIFYPVTELRNSVLMPIYYDYDNENIFNSLESETSLEIIDNGDGSWNIKGDGNGENTIQFLIDNIYNIPTPLKILYEISVISGNLKSFDFIGYEAGTGFGDRINFDNVISHKQGLNSYLGINKTSENNIYFYVSNDSPFEIKISNIIINPPSSNFQNWVYGGFKFNKINNSEFGPQNIRLQEDSFNLPTRLINVNYSLYKGLNEFLDTPVSINTIDNNLSVMMGFKLPEYDPGYDIYLVNAINENGEVFSIKYISGDLLNTLYVKLGNLSSRITFDNNLENHALIMIWDKTNQTLSMAKDGMDLSSPASFIFNEITNPVIIGAKNNNGENSYNSYIGEGILTTDIITNEKWLEFWDRIKDIELWIPPKYVNCNEVYYCDDSWDCDPGIPNYINCDEVYECGEFIFCKK